jgi:hypothetical protein
MQHDAVSQHHSRFHSVWNRPVFADKPLTHVPLLQQREHSAAMEVTKGRRWYARWYAKRLLKLQRFPDARVACATLIQMSRRLVEESRIRITRTKNTLAFSRQQYVN